MSNLLCKVCGSDVIDGCACGEGTAELVGMLARWKTRILSEVGIPETSMDGYASLDPARWLADSAEVTEAVEEREAASSPAWVRGEDLRARIWGYARSQTDSYCLAFSSKEDAIAGGRLAYPLHTFFVARGAVHPASEYLPVAGDIMKMMANRANAEIYDVPSDFPAASVEAMQQLDGLLVGWADRNVTRGLWQIDLGPEEVVPAAPTDAEPVFEAAVSHVERGDGKLLVVWNRRYAGWTMPGGKVEAGETALAAQRRELYEETGLVTESAVHVYEGDTAVKVGPDRGRRVHVFKVIPDTYVAREMEPGGIVAWMSREDFLRWCPFREFYEPYFASLG